MSLHPAADGFARAADVYERARPEYPPEAVAWLVDRLELRSGRSVVDVAAGTGKLTRLLDLHGGTRIAWLRGIDTGAILEESGLYGAPEYAEFRHEQRFDADGLVERVSSISYVALLEGREREELLAQVRDLGERQVSPFAFPYVTKIWAAAAH